jgi:hypothetical protein
LLFIALVIWMILGISAESHFCNHLHHTIFRLLKQSRFYLTYGTTIRIHAPGNSNSHRSPLRAILCVGGVDISCAATGQTEKKSNAVMSRTYLKIAGRSRSAINVG